MSNLRTLWVVAVVALLSLVGTDVHAQGMDAEDVPRELREWIPWVTDNLGSQLCAEVAGSRRCQWPGLLELELDDYGGEFTLYVESDARELRAIVGGDGAWPQAVDVDGKQQAVLSVDGVPSVLLPRGRHRVSGRLLWGHMPETLAVGADTAFVDLQVDGRRIPLVKREHNQLWLKGLSLSEGGDTEKDHVELSVFRQLRDGVPLVVETRLVFQVSGRAREISFAAPLLPDTVPLAVEADLAIALEPNGSLRVQLVPGKHEVTLVARHTKQGAPLVNALRAEPWPAQEIWTFRPDAQLRAVELSGLAGIDASRTELPEDWRSDGAYIAKPDSQLQLTTTRRGQEQVPNNRLSLVREFWLDDSAQAYTVRDRISGTMNQGWRLDLLAGQLGSVTLDSANQVITEHAGHRGVELRDAQLNMTAVSRVPRTGKLIADQLSAVGWSEDADSLSAELHLPPGWRVFSASGVDDTSSTWIARWDLFDVFHLLVVCFAMYRLAGWPAAVTAALALILCRDEQGAPEYVWLPLLVFATLMRLLKEGKLRKAVSGAFYGLGLLTLIALVGFSVDQVRSALYPHLQQSYFGEFEFEQSSMSEAAPQMDAVEEARDDEVMPAAPAEAEADRLPKRAGGGASEGKIAMLQQRQNAIAGLASSSYGQQKQFKPDAIVQTGPGIPEVSGDVVRLSWSGPVVKEHKMSLLLISPWINRGLTVLRLGALFLFGYWLWRFSRHGKLGGPVIPRAAGAAAVMLGMLVWVGEARAAEPSDERLAELRTRLLRPAACSPHCLSVSHLRLSLADELQVTSEVHVGERAAYRLPGPASVLGSPRLQVDGKEAVAMRLEDDGAYYVRLEPGVHEVRLRARLLSDRVTMDVGTAPAHISIDAEGWSVSGVNEKFQVPGGTLTLQREVAFERAGSEDGTGADGVGSDAAEGGGSEVAVPAYFRVERRIALGVTGRVVTRITRLSDASSPEVFRLQLLRGERLTSSGIDVQGDTAAISFPRQESERIVESTISLPTDGSIFELSLTAPAVERSTETWTLECGVIYRCMTDGIVASAHIAEGRSLPTFRPWPGETLRISAEQPPAAPGASLTIHKATLTLTPGVRTGKGRLQFSVQTSRSTVHTVEIPGSAKLESVSVGGVSQAVRAEAGKLRISLQPGLHVVVVEWQEPSGITTWFRSPRVSTGAAGVNFRTVVELPNERWLLLAAGPSQGPALLFWGYLLLIVIAALLLPRLPYAPLRVTQWLLLGLGLTQVPAGVAVLIAGWFFAVGARRHLPLTSRMRKNASQLLLIVYSLIFVSALFAAVYDGLVSSPDMEVRGAGSYNGHLVWFLDRCAGVFPPVRVLSLNIWVWRGFMLVWALWLSRALLSWARWAWEELNEGGFWAPAAAKPKERAAGFGSPWTNQDSGSPHPARSTSAEPQPAASPSADDSGVDGSVDESPVTQSSKKESSDEPERD